MREKMICKMTALLLIVAMCVGLCTGFTVNAGAVGNSASDLRAPGIEEDPGMEAKQKVTWDCVWFGNYPQSEVESSAPIYNTLQGEDGWDDNNDITIGGNRYRRMKKGDATYAVTGDSDHYNWSDEDTYHYFKYEPVKWRVLKTDGNQALLLSDVALDDQRYNTVEEDVTWKTSTIRSWLNGYGSSDNQQGTDYSGRNFIGSAFTSDEWSAIADTSVVNAGNLSSGTEGGNDTVDKIFLLSESEVYGEGAVPYGFVSESDTYDEARRSKSSTYAKAMAVWSATDDTYKDDCHWWLRSPAYYLKSAAGVLNTGNVGGIHVDYNYVGVRPALNLNLSSNQWTYAGTVCSDGTTSSGNGNEDEAAVTGIELLSEEKLNLTVGDTSLVKCKVIPSNAANPAISWTSGDEKIATVNEEGLITCAGAGSTVITATTVDGGFTKEVEVIVREKPSVSELHAPRIEADSSMKAKQKVTWDCVWFGRYPQSEVASASPIYRALKNVDGWDDNNDITIGGNRYRRMKKGDATYAAASSDKYYYNWSDADTYHYFKYEPVKWRVLKTDGNQALLLSDVALDDQKYNTVRENVTWETSTIRSWLNGYGSSDNQQGTDYSGRNFIGSAFTSDEQSAIADTPVVNADNKSYGTEGGNDTVDKIFLLSESEVYGRSAEPYGFVPDWNRYDEARRSKSSTYAKAMGVRYNTDDTYKDNCSWWLRSPGNSSKCASFVNYNGYVYYWSDVNSKYVGVRAALNLNLSSSQWTYAGTVCSDGTSSSGTEDENAVTGIELLSEEKLNLTVGDTSLAKCKVIPSNAANPAISWISWDEKIATVNEEGLITCVGAGTTLITAKTADGGFTKEVEVIVREKPSADKEDPSDPSVSKPAPPKTATLSSTSYTYNGKVRRPSVTVKDSNGKTIGAGNYTVTYPAGRKNVGRYTVKITFKGSYTGSMKKSFEIKPRGTSICRIKAGKKSFTVKWKKQTKQTTGYQIQYSTNKKFKCGKKRTVLVNKSKTPRRKITKLKAKKKYYVRIRTYKTVKIKGKSQKIYSGWSKSKKVVVKK